MGGPVTAHSAPVVRATFLRGDGRREPRGKMRRKQDVFLRGEGAQEIERLYGIGRV